MRMAKVSSRLAERAKAKNAPGIVLPAVKTRMLKDYSRDPSGEGRRWDIVHPSELSHQDRFCPRAVYLRITEGPLPPARFDFVRENIFEEGNQIHLKWQQRLRLATDLWGDWECIVCGTVARDQTEPDIGQVGHGWAGKCFAPGGHVWKYAEITLDAEDTALLCGHADGGFGGTLVEFKSIGEGTVRVEAPRLHSQHVHAGITDMKGLWADIQRPFKTHVNQGDIYLWIARSRGLPFRQIAYVYESKWNQQVKEFIVPYDETRSEALVAQAKAVRRAVRRGREPACRFPGKCAECRPYDARRGKNREGA